MENAREKKIIRKHENFELTFIFQADTVIYCELDAKNLMFEG